MTSTSSPTPTSTSVSSSNFSGANVVVNLHHENPLPTVQDVAEDSSPVTPHKIKVLCVLATVTFCSFSMGSAYIRAGNSSYPFKDVGQMLIITGSIIGLLFLGALHTYCYSEPLDE